MVNLAGVFPPLPTSFNDEDELDIQKIQNNISQLNRYDLGGYLVLGSNGELVNLSEEEKIEVYQAARTAIPKGKLMIAGTGSQSTREAIRLSQAAAVAGADAVLVLNPSYYKGLMTDQALVQHYHELADQCPVPVLIYNMPANSGMDMSAESILKISMHDNIIGLKDSGGNLTKMAAILDACKPGFQVLAGSAGFFLPALSLGAVGGILALANIAPQACINLYDQFHRGALNEAAAMQKKIVGLNTMITRGWGVPALKAAMDHLGYYGGPCRKPIQPLNPENKTALIKALNSLIPNPHSQP